MSFIPETNWSAFCVFKVSPFVNVIWSDQSEQLVIYKDSNKNSIGEWNNFHKITYNLPDLTNQHI